jgi:hypothetical protein
MNTIGSLSKHSPMSRRRQLTPRKYSRSEILELSDSHATERSCTFDFARIDYLDYHPFFHGLPNLIVKTAAAIHFKSSASANPDPQAVEGTIAVQQPKFADYLIKLLNRKLPESRVLTTLTLDSLTIPDTYFKLLVDACANRNTKHLKTLELKEITISASSADYLFSKLSPYRLESLKVTHCGLTETSYDSIIAFLRKQPGAGEGDWTLKELDLDGNELQPDTLGEISELLAGHILPSSEPPGQEEESAGDGLDEGSPAKQTSPPEPLSDGENVDEPPSPPFEAEEPAGNEEEELAEPAAVEEPAKESHEEEEEVPKATEEDDAPPPDDDTPDIAEGSGDGGQDTPQDDQPEPVPADPDEPGTPEPGDQNEIDLGDDFVDGDPPEEEKPSPDEEGSGGEVKPNADAEVVDETPKSPQAEDPGDGGGDVIVSDEGANSPARGANPPEPVLIEVGEGDVIVDPRDADDLDQP